VTTRRVLLGDDHAPTRAGVRLALEGSEFAVVAEAHDARSAVAAALRDSPDICVLDVRMPCGGIGAAAEIAARLSNVVIVMLTVSRDDEDLFAALRAGAAGYLLKDTPPERLPAALRAAADGEAAMSPVLVARLIDEFRSREHRRRVPLLRQRGVRLTDREWEVLQLLREGRSTADIAKRLAISPVTARRHISAILHKLEVPTRAAAVRLLASDADEAGR
jgi:two-component system, NarL family, nitrate/nitrite response regulator NarL